MARTKSNGMDAANNHAASDHPAETFSSDTNDLNFATGTRRSKVEATFCNLLTLAGYAVYPLKDGGYMVRNHINILHAIDLEDLQIIAAFLGMDEQSGGCQ